TTALSIFRFPVAASLPEALLIFVSPDTTPSVFASIGFPANFWSPPKLTSFRSKVPLNGVAAGFPSVTGPALPWRAKFLGARSRQMCSGIDRKGFSRSVAIEIQIDVIVDRTRLFLLKVGNSDLAIVNGQRANRQLVPALRRAPAAQSRKVPHARCVL